MFQQFFNDILLICKNNLIKGSIMNRRQFLSVIPIVCLSTLSADVDFTKILVKTDIEKFRDLEDMVLKYHLSDNVKGLIMSRQLAKRRAFKYKVKKNTQMFTRYNMLQSRIKIIVNDIGIRDSLSPIGRGLSIPYHLLNEYPYMTAV